MPNYKEIYTRLKNHLEKSADSNVLKEDEFTRYMNNAASGAKLSEADQKVHKIILKQMINNQVAENDLKNDLPNIVQEKKAYMQKLKKEAQTFARADTKKKEAAEINSRRKAAKKELENIRKNRITNKANELGKLVNKDDIKEPKLYDSKPTNWARRRNPLIGLMNLAGLGSRSERRGVDKKGNKVPKYSYTSDLWTKEKGAIPIQHISEDGKIRLNGAKFLPKNPHDPEKVALVFSGSHGPGAQYIDSIKKAYLDQGITVVQLDYRGFGTSTNIDERGNHVSNSPSERTMYEDGMEMYKYVNETLGIKPENITLHGYSLGGAIASRVALEVTKKMQNERIMEGEKYDMTKGLGGVVLHSPMKSMYSAASSKTIFGPAAGFMGWAFGGGYNTEEHMLELAKIDRNVPVHLIGGDPNKKGNNFDDLSPQVTGLDKSLAGKFEHLSSYTGQGDHEGKTWKAEKIDNEVVIVKDKDMPNVAGEDQGLSSIIANGREVIPEVHRKMEQRRVNPNAPQMGNNIPQVGQGGGPAM